MGFRPRTVVVAAIIALCAGGFLWQRFNADDSNVIAIGGKDYTEQYVLANLYSELIERNTDLKVNRRINLGGTKVCLAALQSGDIDMYVEYSGTAYGDVLGLPPNPDMREVYDVVKREFKDKYDIVVLQQTGFNNTYTIATTPEIADRYGLKKISDLRGKADQFATAMTFEFLNRQDGLPGLSRHYGFDFDNTNAMNAAQRYVALGNGDVQIIDAFSTDGLLKKFNLVTLEDDQNFFPPYYAMPVMRADAAEKYPQVIPLIESLGERLTDPVMTELNYRVDELRQDPRVVAVDFLREQGMID